MNHVFFAGYQARTLVVNNLSFKNGGAGIQVYSSDNVQLSFNTTYQNSQTPGLNYGELWTHSASNVKFENNIAVTSINSQINTALNNANVTYDFNVYFGPNLPVIKGNNDTIADPMFVDPSANNFRLKPGSPAIDTASQNLDVANDLDGNPRPLGSKADRGAFESKLASGKK